MNKKMIALAVAGVMAAPVAMADVKISGRVAYDLTDNAGGTSDATGFSQNGHTRLQFDGTSGNAFARLALDERFGRDRNGGTGTDDQRNKRDQYVGYKLANGGAVQVGRMAGVLKNLEKDPYIATFLEVRGTTAANGGGGTYGLYGSSSFINNLVQYSQKMGAVAVKIQHGPSDNDGHTGISLKGKVGPATVWVGTNDGQSDASATDQTNTKIGASMKFGNIKATLQLESNEVGAAETDRTLLMVDMGLADGWSANVAWAESDAAGDPAYTRLAIMKKLNKKAAVYFGTVDDDRNGGTETETGIGMVVKF